MRFWWNDGSAPLRLSRWLGDQLLLLPLTRNPGRKPFGQRSLRQAYSYRTPVSLCVWISGSPRPETRTRCGISITLSSPQLTRWKGSSACGRGKDAQAADDRVDRLEAIKRSPHEEELTGVTIDVWVILPD